jgi:hypothetical protein
MDAQTVVGKRRKSPPDPPVLEAHTPRITGVDGRSRMGKRLTALVEAYTSAVEANGTPIDAWVEAEIHALAKIQVMLDRLMDTSLKRGASRKGLDNIRELQREQRIRAEQLGIVESRGGSREERQLRELRGAPR